MRNCDAIGRLVVTPPLVSGAQFNADCPTTRCGALFGWLYSCVMHPRFSPHVQTFIVSCNHSAVVAKEKASYHIQHIIFSCCSLLPQYYNISWTIERRNAYNILFGKFGREESCGLCLNMTLHCSAWAWKWCKNCINIAFRLIGTAV